jgi:hypothetical protein
MSRRGCLLGFLAVVGGCLLFAVFAVRAVQRLAKERLQSAVAEFKSGSSRSIILTSCDLVEALAGDPQCAAKVEEVQILERDLTDPSWGRIRDFKNLSAISIEYSDADALFEKIDGIPSLRSARIDSGVGASTMRFLACCLSVKDVYLRVGGVADPSPVAGHPAIENLSLDNFAISDEWLKVLKSLPRLRTLDVEADVPEGADYAKTCKALETQLQRDLPNCKVGPLK